MRAHTHTTHIHIIRTCYTDLNALIESFQYECQSVEQELCEANRNEINEAKAQIEAKLRELEEGISQRLKSVGKEDKMSKLMVSLSHSHTHTAHSTHFTPSRRAQSLALTYFLVDSLNFSCLFLLGVCVFFIC